MANPERFPIAPDTVTVLGYRVKSHEPRWQGLDFSRAEVLEKANILVAIYGPDIAPPDLHLNVPFAHPDDEVDEYDGVKYRVRPIAKPGKKWRGRLVETVAIEPAPGKDPPWEIVVTFAPQRLSDGC